MADKKDGLKLIRMNEVEAEEIKWLWYLCDSSHKYHYVIWHDMRSHCDKHRYNSG